MCMVLESVLVSFFYKWLTRVPSTLVKEIVFNPLYILASFVEDKVSICAWSPLFLKQCSCSNNEGIPWRVFESLTHHLLKENNNGVLEPAHTSPLVVSLPNSVFHDIIVVVFITSCCDLKQIMLGIFTP